MKIFNAVNFNHKLRIKAIIMLLKCSAADDNLMMVVVGLIIHTMTMVVMVIVWLIIQIVAMVVMVIVGLIIQI